MIGGSGPWASAYAHTQLIRQAQHGYGAVKDQDYPDMLHLSIGLDGFGAKGVEQAALVKTKLFEQIDLLNHWQCDVVLIACNSLYEFYPEIKARTNAEIIHLPREGMLTVKELGLNTVAVLGSDSSKKANIHFNEAVACGLTAIVTNDDQQQKINHIIYRVMGGDNSEKIRHDFITLAQEFEQQGAQAILSGCTELTWLSTKVNVDIPIVDCLLAGVEKTLKTASLKRKMV